MQLYCYAEEKAATNRELNRYVCK